MNNLDIERIINNMLDAGCGEQDIDRIRSMHEAGLDSEIIGVLRKCRCDLMDELRDSQRRVDRMDRIIRMTESIGN